MYVDMISVMDDGDREEDAPGGVTYQPLALPPAQAGPLVLFAQGGEETEEIDLRDYDEGGEALWTPLVEGGEPCPALEPPPPPYSPGPEWDPSMQQGGDGPGDMEGALMPVYAPIPPGWGGFIPPPSEFQYIYGDVVPQAMFGGPAPSVIPQVNLIPHPGMFYGYPNPGVAPWLSPPPRGGHSNKIWSRIPQAMW